MIFANELYYIDRVRAVFRPSLEPALYNYRADFFLLEEMKWTIMLTFQTMAADR